MQPTRRKKGKEIMKNDVNILYVTSTFISSSTQFWLKTSFFYSLFCSLNPPRLFFLCSTSLPLPFTQPYLSPIQSLKPMRTNLFKFEMKCTVLYIIPIPRYLSLKPPAARKKPIFASFLPALPIFENKKT